MPLLPTLPKDKASSTAAASPKTFWDIVITMTPVLLTLLATMLAGLSSSEMTRAQYYRSFAAQSQSKVGDQWAFFQAKRIRSTLEQRTAELLPAAGRKVTPERLEAAVRDLAGQVQACSGMQHELSKTLSSLKNDVGPAGPSLLQSASRLAEISVAGANEAREEMEAIRKELIRAEVKQSFEFLGSDRLPAVRDIALNDAGLQNALQAIRERRPDSEIEPLLQQLDMETLEAAIGASDQNTLANEETGKAVDKQLKNIDVQAKRAVGLTIALHHAIDEWNGAMAEGPAGFKGMEKLRPFSAVLARADRNIQRDAEVLQDYRTARGDYTARRSEREARYNQQAAELYEVLVRKNSVVADRHRVRSKHFFYGMLCAQAGVAMASFAMAARFKSTLWGLGSLAGITALAFSGYVYLFM